MFSNKGRTVAIAAVVAIGIAFGVAGATAMADGPVKDLKSAPSDPSRSAKPHARSFQASTVPQVKASDKATKKLSKKLKKLTKAHNRLVTAHNNLARDYNALASDYYNCELTRDVTQYSGYDYFGSIGATTALDFSEPGSPVDERMVVYVC